MTVLLAVFFFSVEHMYAQSNPRKTLWINGPSPTSNQWSRAKTSALLAGFQMDVVNDWPYNNNNIANDIPTWADEFNEKLIDGAHNDVLGIGHDAGGLILRYMDMTQKTDRLSAMILDGVPNQGAGIMDKLLPISVGVESEAQRTVRSLLNLRTQAQGCLSCQMLEATQNWINVFANSGVKTYYEQLKPGSPTITNLTAPNIPFAIIWGNEDEDDALTLTRLVGSWHNAGLFGEDYEYLDCYQSELNERLQDAQFRYLLGSLKTVVTLAQAASKIKVLDPSSVFGYIESQINTVLQQLELSYNLANDLREIFECELIHQALNAKWNLMVSQYNVTTTVETIQVPPNCISCDVCYDELDQQVQGYCFSVCDNDCPLTTPVDITYHTYQLEPHDGLLTETEQMLGGAVKIYEAEKVNHFQEQFWQYQLVGHAFQDLFSGAAGAAFRVQ